MKDELKRQLVEIVKLGYERRPEPFQLSSGEWSRDYIDGKRALASGENLTAAAVAVLALAKETGIRFDAAGGLTMGADPLAHAVASTSGCGWFSVRKARKTHGAQKLIEGFDLDENVHVLLLDDVVTTGASIFLALDAVQETGAHVTLAVTLLDRGDIATEEFRRRNVLYRPLMTYKDLGIEPVGRGAAGD